MLDKSNKDYNWGEIYDIYEDELRDNYKNNAKYQNEAHQALLEHFIKLEKIPHYSFCEIGFGHGLTLRWASNFFTEVYGLDISEKNIKITEEELSKEGFKNIHLKKSDILERDESLYEKFDVITFIHGIEHFSQSDYKILFENIKFYLKKGGIFTGALPNNLPLRYRMCPNCKNLFEIDGHYSVHTKQSLKELFNHFKADIIYLDSFNLPYYLKKRSKSFYLLRTFIGKVVKSLDIPRDGQLEFIIRWEK